MQKSLAFLRSFFTRRNLMRLVFTLAVLAALWTAFCLEERTRGRRVWQTYRDAAIARGVPMEVEAVQQPDLPEAQNFAVIPMIQDLFTNQQEGQSPPAWFAALKMDSTDKRNPTLRKSETLSL